MQKPPHSLHNTLASHNTELCLLIFLFMVYLMMLQAPQTIRCQIIGE